MSLPFKWFPNIPSLLKVCFYSILVNHWLLIVKQQITWVISSCLQGFRYTKRQHCWAVRAILLLSKATPTHGLPPSLCKLLAQPERSYYPIRMHFLIVQAHPFLHNYHASLLPRTVRNMIHQQNERSKGDSRGEERNQVISSNQNPLPYCTGTPLSAQLPHLPFTKNC